MAEGVGDPHRVLQPLVIILGHLAFRGPRVPEQHTAENTGQGRELDKERERERERQTDRQTDRERQRDTETERVYACV